MSCALYERMVWILDKINISTEYIKLEQMMKLAGVVGSGSDAKHFISEGTVKVNGNVELQRGKKLRYGDIIEFEGKKYIID